MPPLSEVGVGVAPPAIVALRLKLAGGCPTETGSPVKLKLTGLEGFCTDGGVWIVPSEPVPVRVIELNRLGLLIEIWTEVIVSLVVVEPLVTENTPAFTLEPGLVFWVPGVVTATAS
jgi:hypothetical protein